jgi:hypothetical protein
LNVNHVPYNEVLFKNASGYDVRLIQINSVNCMTVWHPKEYVIRVCIASQSQFQSSLTESLALNKITKAFRNSLKKNERKNVYRVGKIES